MSVAPGWQWFLTPDFDGKGDERKTADILAYKKALIANGYSRGIVLTTPQWGNFAVGRCKEFQAAAKIGVDGVVGPETARYLCRFYVDSAEKARSIPDHLIGRQGTLESNNHAVAQGYVDPADEGWAQIHLPYHQEVTKAQAWDLAYAIPWMADELVRNTKALGGDWDGGLAAYNIGYYTAKQWVQAGKPPQDGPVWSGNIDTFQRATNYVTLVRAAKY